MMLNTLKFYFAGLLLCSCLTSCSAPSPSNLSETATDIDFSAFGFDEAPSFDEINKLPDSSDLLGVDDAWSDTYQPMVYRLILRRWQRPAPPTNEHFFSLYSYLSETVASYNNDQLRLTASPAEKHDMVFARVRGRDFPEELAPHLENLHLLHDNMIASVKAANANKRFFALKDGINAMKRYIEDNSSLVDIVPLTTKVWWTWANVVGQESNEFGVEPVIAGLKIKPPATDREGNQFTPTPIGWYGWCHAWGPAASYVEPPKSGVQASLSEDKEVIFAEGDLRGLITAAWHYQEPDTIFVGNRCEATKIVRDETNGKKVVDFVSSSDQNFTQNVQGYYLARNRDNLRNLDHSYPERTSDFDDTLSYQMIALLTHDTGAKAYAVRVWYANNNNEKISATNFIFSQLRQAMWFQLALHTGSVQTEREEKPIAFQPPETTIIADLGEAWGVVGKALGGEAVYLEETWSCRNLNPVAFHLVTGSVIGEKKLPVVMDRATDHPVWNYPHSGYKTISKSELRPVNEFDQVADFFESRNRNVKFVQQFARKIKRVNIGSASVRYAGSSADGWSDPAYYVLGYDENLKLVDGEWGDIKGNFKNTQPADFSFFRTSRADPEDRYWTGNGYPAVFQNLHRKVQWGRVISPLLSCANDESRSVVARDFNEHPQVELRTCDL